MIKKQSLSLAKRLKQVSHLPYLPWVREQLYITNTSVRKWADWDPESDVYEAHFENRSVVIPIPVCDWSFLVALHEIGHISTGDRLHSYLREYNTERWAIKRAKDAYGITNADYVMDARAYVKMHLIQDLQCTSLKLNKVKPYVLDWIGETVETLEILQNT